MSAREPIAVVCGLIADAAGRVLVAQRPWHKHLGGKWEFAGGKVEPGEDPRVALQRELKEELGCDVVVGHALPVSVHDYGSALIAMAPFVCALDAASAPPAAHEHLAVRWVTFAELRTLDLAPADWPVVDAYAAWRQAGR